MAEVKKCKNKSQKGSVSATSTISKTLPKRKLDFDQSPSYNSGRKSRSVENKCYLNERKKGFAVKDFQPINIRNSNIPEQSQQKQHESNSSLAWAVSPRKRSSQIPIPSRNPMKFLTRSVSPTKRIFTFSQKLSRPSKVNLKKKSSADDSRESTPRHAKTLQGNNRSPTEKIRSPSRCRSVSRTSKNRNEEECSSPILDSKRSRNLRPERKTCSADEPSSGESEKKSNDRTLIFQDDDILIKTTESISKENCRKSPSVIRTMSGHDLFLTPFLDVGDVDVDESEGVALSQLLKEAEEKFEQKTFSDIQVFQDDANEYESESTTDDEANSATIYKSEKKSQKLANSTAWKNQQEELLDDVDYRQSLYHPTIARRQMEQQNNFVQEQQTRRDQMSKLTRNDSKRKSSHSFWLPNKTAQSPRQGSWTEKNILSDEREIYDGLLECPKLIKESKRERTKGERVTGALLRFTAKTIRLLAMFNLWPGGIAHILTSNSLHSR